MAWSFLVGRIAGTEIRIHITFFILLVWIGIAHYRDSGLETAALGLLFIVSIFACVLAHEFGHILTARRFGIQTPYVTLLPIGGVASLERMPEKPQQEIVVALAGPFVNLVIAAILFSFADVKFDTNTLQSVENPNVGFLSRLAAINVFLAVFNLIPAFPMDGGRVFRALLSLRISRVQSTTIAAKTGQGLAFLFGFMGLLSGNPLLLFIAIFVYLAAAAEEQATVLQAVIKDHHVRDAMITSFESLRPQDTIAVAAQCLLRTTQLEFPIVNERSKLLGILTRTEMVRALASSGPQTPIEEVMDRDIPICTEDTDLQEAIKLLQARAKPAVSVVNSDGKLVGYLTKENLAEMMMIESAKRNQRVMSAVGT